ncbi:uncharacterized protein YALI1_C16982g [Yarrowia lipolytica]|uniref:Secreted protein n=1 Tax=Yarrowia lipolytica TaxID=4952 RepID=A0A1D8NAT3_YARLL|nr:hypothetical protein YALI1_C16982g [Yarrowia lipolytica]
MSKRPRMFLRSSSMILCPVVSFSVAILGWPEIVKVDTYPSMEVIYGTGTTRDTQIVRSFCQLIKRLTLSATLLDNWSHPSSCGVINSTGETTRTMAHLSGLRVGTGHIDESRTHPIAFPPHKHVLEPQPCSSQVRKTPKAV